VDDHTLASSLPFRHSPPPRQRRFRSLVICDDPRDTCAAACQRVRCVRFHGSSPFNFAYHAYCNYIQRVPRNSYAGDIRDTTGSDSGSPGRGRASDTLYAVDNLSKCPRDQSVASRENRRFLCYTIRNTVPHDPTAAENRPLRRSSPSAAGCRYAEPRSRSRPLRRFSQCSDHLV